MNNTIARKRAPIPCAYDADKWGGGVYVADVGIDPRELSPAPVEWSHTWSSVYVQTLTLLPYSVQCICTDPDAVPIPCACIADKWGGGVCGRCGSQHPGALCSPSGVNLCPCQVRQGGPRTCSEAAWRCCLCWYVPLFFHSHLHFFLMYVFFVQFLRGGVLSLDTRAAF